MMNEHDQPRPFLWSPNQIIVWTMLSVLPLTSGGASAQTSTPESSVGTPAVHTTEEGKAPLANAITTPELANEGDLPFGEELNAELKNQGRTVRFMSTFQSTDIVPEEIGMPVKLPVFSHRHCPRLDHINALHRRGLTPLEKAPIPPKPFGIVIQATDEHYRYLPRFKETLHALWIEDGSFCNIHNTDHLRDIPQLKELRTLHISTGLGDTGAQQLAELHNLHSLIARSASLTDTGLSKLAELRHLRELVLTGYGTNITGVGLASLSARSLLIVLRLPRAPLTDEGMRNLRDFASLKVLDLQSTTLSDEGLAAIQELMNLRTLNLSTTVTSDQGIQHLSMLSNLNSLNLANTHVTDAAIDVLVKLPKLRSLNLSNTRTSYAALQPLRDRNIQLEWSIRRTPMIADLKSPIDRESHLQLHHGRTLEAWFADLQTPANTPETREIRSRAEAELKEAAKEDPEVSHLAFYYGNRHKAQDRGEIARIVMAAEKLSLSAIHDQLNDGVEQRYDHFCLERLTKLEDQSPEAIAALICCLYATPKKEGDDYLNRRAAACLEQIGLPVINQLLQDRQLDGHPSPLNSQILKSIGVKAAKHTLEHSLKHPDDFLSEELGAFCCDFPDTIAPSMITILQDKARGDCHRHALKVLAIAVAPKVTSNGRRVLKQHIAEHVVDLAVPYLENEDTAVDAANIVAGWSPKSDAARNRVAELFNKSEKHRQSYLYALSMFQDVPSTTAETLLEYHEQVPKPGIDSWCRALSRLPAESKAMILPRMREHAAKSPRAAIGVMALDPSPVSRDSMLKILNEMKEKSGERGAADDWLKWVPNQ